MARGAGGQARTAVARAACACAGGACLAIACLVIACGGGARIGSAGAEVAEDPTPDAPSAPEAGADPSPERMDEPGASPDPGPSPDPDPSPAEHDPAGEGEVADPPIGDAAADAPGGEVVPPCPDTCPDDEDPCTEPACDPEDGCVLVPSTGTPCDDLDACTTGDTCVAGRCLGQVAPCDDGDPCTADWCEPATGCGHGQAEDGTPCDDLDACTAGDACLSGACGGSAVGCDDGDPCTKDGCEPATGCTRAPLTGPWCDDGSACTGGDHCDAGACAGKPVSCNDGNPCTADGCDPAAGCVHPAADGAPCNDGDACTDLDRCAAGICVGQATACDDGNPCTADRCGEGAGCIHTQPAALPCDDHDACTVGDLCFNGACEPGPPADCDDRNECTADGCDPASGCAHVPTPGAPCDDASACTSGDACDDATCDGVKVECDDGNLCTTDSCDPASGCVYAPAAGPCDDGDPCTSGDFCDAGACRPGPDPDCLAVKRVVLGGDSWSAGLILPMREAFDARGYEEVPISWELTAKPGSRVAGWLADPDLMAALFLSLDAEPRADILFFTLGGNDFLGACKDGLGVVGALEWWWILTSIQADLQAFMALAQAGRPHLKVVLIGYDYLHFDMIQAMGIGFPGMDVLKFNLGLVDLAGRQRDAAAAGANRLYAHNMGLLQHVFGDHAHPPFLCPGLPVCPEYPPEAAPMPGPAPGYVPFPGGWWTYPSPLDHIPDGIHPDAAGFRAIIDNTLDQGAGAWIEGK